MVPCVCVRLFFLTIGIWLLNVNFFFLHNDNSCDSHKFMVLCFAFNTPFHIHIYHNTNKTAYSLTKSSDIISKRIWWTRTHTRLFKKEKENVWHFLCFGLMGIEADNHYSGCRTEENTKRTKANITFIIRTLVVGALWHDINATHEWRNDESTNRWLENVMSSYLPSIHPSYSSPNSNS